MQTLSESTRKYLEVPRNERFQKDMVHLSVTKSIDKTLSHFIADFYNPTPYAPEGKRHPCIATSQWVQQFPEMRHLNNKNLNTFRVELPITDMVVERIAACFTEDRITFEDFETELMYRKVLLRGVQADNTARVYAEFKEHRTVPTHSLTHSSEYPLIGYQQVALYNSYNADGYGLFMEQGTGKTPVGVALICNEAEEVWKKEGRMYKAIIVCPKNVRTNWENEFKKFATTSGKVTILRGDALDRTKQLLEALIEEDGCKYSVVICSYESLSRSWNALEHIISRTPGKYWDLSLLDESHYIKNEQTKRYKFATKLRDISNRRCVLTGTPITNTPLDLFTQLEFLGKGYSGFYSFKAFRKFFARYQMDQATGREVITGLQNLPFMQERLARYSFIVHQKEVQKDLPDRVYDAVEVEMSAQQRKLYEQVRDQLVIEAEESLDHAGSNKQMIVSNILTKLLKLTQITSGFVSWSAILDEITGEEIQPASVDRIDPDPKLELLVEMLKEKGPNEKTIVWSCWVQNIKTIKARLAIEGIDAVDFYGGTSDEQRKINEERFNCDPNCKVFIGNPAAGGTGLNLIGYPPEGHQIYKDTGKTSDDWETNCNHVIYYSQNWSPTARSQSEKRAHRRGTRGPVRITDLVVPGTIDLEIREVVLEKQIRALEIADLRKILSSVLTGNLISD